MADLKRRIIAEFSAKNKAKGVMGGFRRDMDSVGRTMRRMAVGALAVAGIGGLGYMLKKQMETIDATAKLSDRLGVTTEKLIGLQHAASITGTDAETLNKSLEIFTRRLGEMTQGSGEAKRGLDMLGLTAEQLIHISPAEAFGIAADKIKQLGTQAEKTAAAYFLFGRAGSKMLNMLEVGSEGLRGFQNEVEKLGLTFSRLDAAQVEAANDALTRARATMTGLFRQATIELSPYIEVLADKFVDVATAGEGLGANVVNVFESMSLAAIRLGDIIHGLSAKYMAFQAGALEGAASILEISAKIEKYSLGWGVGAKLGRKALGVEGPAEIAKRYRERAAELMEGAGQAAVSTYGQENAVKRFYDNLRKQADAWQVEYEKRSEQHVDTTITGLQEETEAQRKAAAEIEQVRTEIRTEMWLKEEEAAYHAMRAPIIAAEELAKESAERRKRIAEDIAMSMAQSWTSAIDQMMFEGKKFWDAMEDMARSLIRMIANIFIYKKIAEPFAYGLMGLPVPGMTASAPTGGFATTPHGLPFIPAGAGPGGLQHGGEVMETGWAKVHKGETFSGVGGGKLEVNVNYTGEERPKVTEAAFDFKRQVLNINLDAMTHDIGYQNAMKQATRS